MRSSGLVFASFLFIHEEPLQFEQLPLWPPEDLAQSGGCPESRLDCGSIQLHPGSRVGSHQDAAVYIYCQS